MQTQITPDLLATDAGREADEILRSCVHCGFCTATCPTYQLLGDELDGPRGRIYQIKNLFEGEPATRQMLTHLDRCLSCRSCESTCPSGVRYGALLDLGRAAIERQTRRPVGERLLRWGLRQLLPRRRLFGALLRTGQAVRPLLPAALKAKLPPRVAAAPAATNPGHPRRVILAEGCVQPSLTPNTNAATMRVLDRLGITTVTPAAAGCCGAVSQHLAAPDEAATAIRRNIDAWWPLIEADPAIEAILVTASGCGAMVKEYGDHLKHDPAYAEKAQRVAELARDLSEFLQPEQLAPLAPAAPREIAFHSPCTLQHGQRLRGRTEELLEATGFKLTPVADPHLCCGSAGTYSILQPELANQLRDNKLAALQLHRPSLIATANVGCQTHLAAASEVPVVHWIELFDRA